MKMDKQDKHYMLLGIVAVVVIVIILFAVKHHNQVPHMTAVEIPTVNLPASSILDNGQIMGTDIPGQASLTVAQQEQLGLMTPEMDKFMNG